MSEKCEFWMSVNYEEWVMSILYECEILLNDGDKERKIIK